MRRTPVHFTGPMEIVRGVAVSYFFPGVRVELLELVTSEEKKM